MECKGKENSVNVEDKESVNDKRSHILVVDDDKNICDILKMYFERLPAMYAWLLKISCLDSMLMLCLILVRLVFTTADFFPFAMPTFILGTAFFILYDIVLTMCISVYMIKLRKIFKLPK